MVTIRGPLFSQKASKQFGHRLIFKTKGNKAFLTNYNKPGSVNKFTPSAQQIIMRDYMKDARDAWTNLSEENKQAWNGFVIPKRG